MEILAIRKPQDSRSSLPILTFRFLRRPWKLLEPMIEQLKREIPSSQRAYDAATKSWSIRLTLTAQLTLASLCGNFYDQLYPEEVG